MNTTAFARQQALLCCVKGEKPAVKLTAIEAPAINSNQIFLKNFENLLAIRTKMW